MTDEYQWLADAQNIMNNAKIPQKGRAVYDPVSGMFVLVSDINVSGMYSIPDNKFIGISIVKDGVKLELRRSEIERVLKAYANSMELEHND